MTTEKLDFWELRKRLDAMSSRATQKEAETALRAIVTKAVDRAHPLMTDRQNFMHEGWWDIPRLEAIFHIIGRDQDPYNEIIKFWIPFAVEHARVEASRQQKRIELMRKNDEIFKTNWQNIKDGLNSLFEEMRLFDQLWSENPFRPHFNNPISETYLQKDIVEITFQIRKLLGMKAFVPIERIANHGTKVDMHGNTDFWARAFIAVLAISWSRLISRNPSDDIAGFKDFVDTIWFVLNQDDEPGRFDNAIKVVLDDTLPWKSFRNLGWLAENMKWTWREIINSSKTLDDDDKNFLLEVIETEEYLPMSLKEYHDESLQRQKKPN